MTDNKESINESQQYEENEINLLDLLIVLAKHKRMILGMTFGVAIITLIVTLIMPKIYTGTTKILPPQQSQSSASALLNQLSGQMGGVAGLTASSLGIKNPNDLYVAMLKSRNIMEKISTRFELQKVYEEETLTDTLRKLDKNVSISSGKDGIISVDVDDKDARRAADMANAFIEELDKLMQTFSLTEASQRRLFFDQQLRQSRDKLTDAEMILDKTPKTSLKYLDALRNVKYQEAVWEILAKQFEMAKLDEAKDFPLVQVLDKAIPPEKKSKPKLSLIVFMAMLLAFFSAVISAFVSEFMRQAKARPEKAEQMHVLRNALRF